MSNGLSEDGYRVARVVVERRFLPFVTPLSTGAGEISGRDVALVSVTDGDGRRGWGEAAPLPGWGVGDVPEIESWIGQVRPELVGAEPDPASALLQSAGSDGRRAPSGGASALGCALGDLRSQQLGISLAALLVQASGGEGQAPAAAVPVNALIGALDLAGSVAAAVEAVTQGFRTLKCKVGDGPADADAERIRAVVSAAQDAAGESVAVRVDANGAWSIADALAFEAGLRGLKLEWLEDPVPPHLLGEVGPQLEHRVATEWRADSSHLALLESGAVSVVMLKLPVVGGPMAAIASAQALAAAGGTPVVTSFLGSSIGIHAALHTAAAAASLASSASPVDGPPAHGLATASLLAKDFAEPPEIVAGQMRVTASAGMGVTPSER